MDIDEDAFRQGTVTPGLFGYLLVPYMEGSIQSGKAPSRVSESAILEAIAQEIIDQMDDKTLFIIGPGTTTRPILERMGLEKTLLGIDVVFRRKLLTRDANEIRFTSITRRPSGKDRDYPNWRSRIYSREGKPAI